MIASDASVRHPNKKSSLSVFDLETAVHLLNRHPLVSRIAIDKNMISILFTGSREEEAQLLRQLVEQKVLVTSFRREHNNLESVFFHLTDPVQGGTTV